VSGEVTDAQRLDWVLPIVEGDDTPEANLRTQALAASIMLGKTGRDMLDFAMEGSP
jgi:hypothetical protein